MITNRDMEAPFPLRGPTPISGSNTPERNNRDDIRQSTVVSRRHISPKGIIVFILIALFIYWAFSGGNTAKAPSSDSRVYEKSLKAIEKPNTVTEGVITLKMDNAPQNREEATKNARWSEEESRAPESYDEALRRARWSDEN